MAGCPASFSSAAQRPPTVPVPTAKVIGSALESVIGLHLESVIGIDWNPQLGRALAVRDYAHYLLFDDVAVTPRLLYGPSG